MTDPATDLHLRYLTDAILTATPLQRLLMLFDGFTSDLDAAEKGFAVRNWKLVSDHLVHAEEILIALRDPLDRQTPLGANLHAVYGFCLAELIRANLEKDASRIPDVQRIVQQIADANRAAASRCDANLAASA